MCTICKLIISGRTSLAMTVNVFCTTNCLCSIVGRHHQVPNCSNAHSHTLVLASAADSMRDESEVVAGYSSSIVALVDAQPTSSETKVGVLVNIKRTQLMNRLAVPHNTSADIQLDMDFGQAMLNEQMSVLQQTPDLQASNLSLLSEQSPLIKLKLLALQNISVTASTLSRTGADACIQTTSCKLVI